MIAMMAKLHYPDSPSEKEKQAFAKFLAEDEELILATGYGKIYLRQKFISYILIPGAVFILGGLGLAYFLKFNLGYGMLVGLALAGVVAYLRAAWIYNANRYLLTTRRLIIKKGLFTVNLTSALYDKITHIEVVQGIWDRAIMHHGKIIVNTAGMNKGEITLFFVDRPVEFKNLMERLINREREHYGKGLSSITTVEGEIIE